MDLIDVIRTLTTVILTIVANQKGELVPDRTDVINKLIDILDVLNTLGKDEK